MLRLPPEAMIYTCRALAVVACLLPAASLVTFQFMLLAGILLSMTMIPGICLQGMDIVAAHRGAIHYDIAKWTCSIALLATAAMELVGGRHVALEAEFAALACCGMMQHNRIPRLALAGAAGAACLWLDFGRPATAILLLASAVFVLMTVMWRLLDRDTQLL